MNILKDISIIFINYNSKEVLKKAIISDKKFYDEELEIIIFNNSKEEDLNELKNIYRNIKIIVSDKNFGFTKGCNIAVNNTNGKYILLLNPDVIFINNFLKEGVEFLENNSYVSAVGFKILNPDKSIQKESLRNIPTPLNTLLRFLGLDKFIKLSKPYYDENYEKVHEVEILSGACMLIRKEAFLDIGGFDESFFLYGDDIDLCIRLRKNGYKLYYLPIESVIHYKGGSLNKFSLERIYLSHRAMFLFIKKYYSKNLLLFIILSVGIFIRFLIFIFISLILYIFV